MSSCAASCCICSLMGSCASGTSASWPIANVPPTCHSVFSCSARLQLRRPNKTRRALATRAIFGSAPSVADRWWWSRGSPLPKSNFVLHLWSPLPHETTLAYHESSACFGTVRRFSTYRRTNFLFRILHALSSQHFLVMQPTFPRIVSAVVLRRTTPAHLHATPPLHSICIGPASAAIAAAPFKSLYRKRAITPSSRTPLLHRASDTTLGLLARNNYRLARDSTGILICQFR